MNRPLDTFLLALFLLTLLVLAPSNAAFAGVRASFRFPLSNFSGPVLSQWARLAVDREHNEVYALNRRGNDIRVFNEQGMETFVFADGYASAADIAIGRDGDIWLLSTGYQTATVHLLDYRGEHPSEIVLKNVPAEFSKFIADRLVYENRSLYLVDSDALLVIVVDERGYFKAGHDLNTPLKPALTRENRRRQLENTDWKKKQLEHIELNGFSVDEDGNMFFTVPVLFSAYKLSPRGEVIRFGKAGSAPGKFGIVAGIATDAEGYVYVSDRLRSVVLIFDPNLVFQTEFGYRGNRPSNLIVPDDLAIDSSGNVYVGQAANRGVSVFRVVHEAASPSKGSNDATPSRVEKNTRSSRVTKKARTSRAAKKVRSSRVRSKKAKSSRVDEAASPSRGSETKPPVSEKPERIIRKYVPEPAEFVVDEGDDAPSTDSEEPEWSFEEIGSDQQEDKEND